MFWCGRACGTISATPKPDIDPPHQLIDIVLVARANGQTEPRQEIFDMVSEYGERTS